MKNETRKPGRPPGTPNPNAGRPKTSAPRRNRLAISLTDSDSAKLKREAERLGIPEATLAGQMLEAALKKIKSK